MELHELSQRFYSELIKFCDNERTIRIFEIQIDDEKLPFTPVMYGYVVSDFDEKGKLKINQLKIDTIKLQFPDWETKLPEKYVDKIYEFITQ